MPDTSRPADPTPAFSDYADATRLVSSEWLSAHIGNPRVKAVEADEDLLLYDIGHIPGAVKVNARAELDDPTTRDIVDGAAFAALMRDKGIERTDTVVLYGDKFNRWAAYGLWVCTLFGHADVRLLDGGRDFWNTEGRETTLDWPYWRAEAEYPEAERDDHTHRAFRDAVATRIGKAQTQLLDVRSPGEYAGEIRSAARGGHIPTAHNVAWQRALTGDGRFRSAAELRELYSELSPELETVVYCHAGEQAAHSWFVLKYLLGFRNVRVYDGSWSEWGNTVKLPISSPAG